MIIYSLRSVNIYILPLYGTEKSFSTIESTKVKEKLIQMASGKYKSERETATDGICVLHTLTWTNMIIFGCLLPCCVHSDAQMTVLMPANEIAVR